MELKKNGSQPSARGPAEYFTGTVRIDQLFKAPSPMISTTQRAKTKADIIATEIKG